MIKLNANILLGVTGSIAAYKTPELVRHLRAQGYAVKIVLTAAGKKFVTPLTLQAVAGESVYETLLSSESEAVMSHIELARWADMVLIAPASANFIARLAHGFADDLLTTICLATQAHIVAVPAMNQSMWLNAATQANVCHLTARNIKILGPADGIQACGETGPGRMLEPQHIVDSLAAVIKPLFLRGKKILITAGPTREPLDPVRYLSNNSSGKMGYALAIAAREAGADVTLVSGPVALTAPAGVRIINVDTALHMFAAVENHIMAQDIFISTAAVADYYCPTVALEKIKKSDADLTINLSATPDILSYVSALPTPVFTVGFAAETVNVIKNARKKLRNKKAQMIVANDVSNAAIGFNSDYNAVTVLSKNSQAYLAKAPKQIIAYQILQLIAQHFAEFNSNAAANPCNTKSGIMAVNTFSS